MEREKCRMHGQVSRDSFYWLRSHLMDIHGPRRDWRGNKRPQDPTMCGQISGSICLMQRKASRSKSGLSSNQSSKMPNNYVVSSSLKQMMQNLTTPWKTLIESWKFRCQEQCLEKDNNLPRGNLPRIWEKQDHMCLYYRCRRIYEDNIGRCAAQVSRRSHCCKRNTFIEPLQFGTWVYSNASSIENSRCASSSGKIMEKLEKKPAWQLTKVRNKKRWSKKQGIKAEKFISCHWWISRIRSWSLDIKSFQGRVVHRGDIVKDNSGSYAALTEQGSSASQMTAAKVMDIIARLPGCAGHAADPVSATTQVKMEDAPIVIVEFQSQNAPLSSMEDQSWLLSKICTVIFWQGFYGNGNMRKFFWNTVGKSFQIGNVFRQPRKGLFLSVYVDDIKLAGKKQNINPTWKVLMKDVDKREPTSFLDHVYLGCTQRECEYNYRSMFESRISARATEKLPEAKATGKPDAETIFSWSYDMEGHAKKCVENILRTCE